MNKEEKNSKLKKALYRKASAEKGMAVWSKGIKIYSDFIDTCKDVTRDLSIDEATRNEARVKMHEAQVPLNHYITSFKLAQREIEHYILPEIENLTTEEEREGLAFKDLQKEYEDISNNEYFTKLEKQPDNVELEGVNKSLNEHIELLETMIEGCKERADKSKDTYEKAKINLDMFKYTLQLQTNKKRLKERLDYYNNQFKPRYEAEMKEAEQYLDLLIERANELVRLQVDIKLPFLLQEYEKNKEDEEKKWLFYTALKSRINNISKEMRKNKHLFKGKMHLAKPIVE